MQCVAPFLAVSNRIDILSALKGEVLGLFIS